VLADLEREVEKIKAGKSTKLLDYSYSTDGKTAIDLKSFVEAQINKALAKFDNQADDYTWKVLKTEAKDDIYLRIKKKFNFTGSLPRKELNEFMSYFKMTVQSAVNNYFRDRYPDYREVSSLSEVKESEASYTALSSPPQTPDNKLINEKRLRKLYETITELPAKQRKALVECSIKGRTQKDLAEELGISQQAVSNRLKNARDNLAEVLVDKELYTRSELNEYGKKAG